MVVALSVRSVIIMIMCKMCDVQNGVRGDWAELGRTETLANSLEPEWQTSLSLRYHFHQRQLLRLSVYDEDTAGPGARLADQDSLGTAEVSLGAVLAGPGHSLTLPLSPHRHQPGDCGLVTITAAELSDGTRDKVTIGGLQL